VGADTVLSQIIKMVEEAQGTKPPIQRLADRIASVFVPVVLAVAAMTFAVWLAFGPAPALSFAFVTAVSVLLIACPCLFRKGAALETLARVDTVVLDKTGTLTLGRPELTDFIDLRSGGNGADVADETLRLVAAAEAKSEHPIAEAIVRAAQERGLELPAVSDFRADPGFGLEAKVQGHRIQVGADRYMERLGIDLSSVAARAAALAGQAKSPLYAAVDGVLAAAVAVSDPLKDSSREALQALQSLGFEAAMLTGDNRATAEAIAREVGIDRVLAEVLPDQKAAEVKRLQHRDRHRDRGGRRYPDVRRPARHRQRREPLEKDATDHLAELLLGLCLQRRPDPRRRRRALSGDRRSSEPDAGGGGHERLQPLRGHEFAQAAPLPPATRRRPPSARLSLAPGRATRLDGAPHQPGSPSPLVEQPV
jgi:phosphoglycolate phosphatase-like HAD superfamily hydrolase